MRCQMVMPAASLGSRIRQARPTTVWNSLAKPLLVVLHAVPHVHAKDRLEVLWERVGDVKAGDLRGNEEADRWVGFGVG